jgi:hypothetical protein
MELEEIKRQLQTLFLISGISYKKRISKLQKIILSRKNIRKSTLFYANKEKDILLKLQFIIAGYELLNGNNYAKDQ